MLVKFSPQRNDNKLKYVFTGKTATVTLSGDGISTKMDTFDFSTLQDGDEVARNAETGQLEIETSLPLLPILEARRENGQVIITVLKYHGADAPEEERFLEPLEVV
jgi:hypothetical protein